LHRDFPQAAGLVGYLDRLEQENALPKLILYNNNPADNYLFASIAGSFQDGSVPGKFSLGLAGGFLDQKEGYRNGSSTRSRTSACFPGSSG